MYGTSTACSRSRVTAPSSSPLKNNTRKKTLCSFTGCIVCSQSILPVWIWSSAPLEDGIVICVLGNSLTVCLTVCLHIRQKNTCHLILVSVEGNWQCISCKHYRSYSQDLICIQKNRTCLNECKATWPLHQLKQDFPLLFSTLRKSVTISVKIVICIMKMDNDLYANVKFSFLDFRFFYCPIFTAHNIFLLEHTLNFSILLHWDFFWRCL